MRYTQLDGWVATSGFDSQLVQVSDDNVGIDVSYRSPEAIVAELPDAKLEISFSWQLREASPLRHERTLAQLSAFVLRFPKSTPLEQTLDYVYQLRNFLGLAVGRPVVPVSVRGNVLPPPNAEADPFTRLPPRKPGVKVFYRLGPSVPDTKDVHPAQMLFTLPEARERIETLLNNWFGKQQLLRPVFDLYFGAVYNRHAFLDQRFLSLMQAVETYHRRTSGGTDLPEDEHAERVEAILAATPDQFSKWLAGRLEYSNQLVLRKRLDDVLKKCPTIVKKLIENRGSFAHRLRLARNYLTHYDESLEDEAPKGMDLYPFAVQLQALVEMCLLVELGFNCDEIDGFFDRVGRYADVATSRERE